MSPTNKNTNAKTVRSKAAAVSRIPAKNSRKKAVASGKLVIDLPPTAEPNNAVSFIKRKLKGEKSAAPSDLKPMLAGIAGAAFNDPGWQFEIKWDGYRALAYQAKGKTELRSRNNLSFNKKYAEVAAALAKWKVNAVVDGEIVVLNEEGHADFEALQKWNHTQEGTLVYFIFDLLWFEGVNLMGQPLTERQSVLKKILPPSNVLRFSDSIDEYGIDFFKVAQQNGLEGIIAKKKNAPYVPGARAKTWLKIKAEEKHEAIICGYTRNRESDRLFSSLVLGVPANGKMKFIGQVGTGFSAASQKEILKKLEGLRSNTCPFEKAPNTGAPTEWVTPYLVCEVKYTELTSEGLMRHPSFQGIREDKTITDLNEAEVPLNEKRKKPATPAKKKADTETVKIDTHLIDLAQKEALITVDKIDLKFTNIQKIYWPKEKITKGQLINYYHSVAQHILPYMKDRPVSLNRHPNGIDGESFYQKDMTGKGEPWIKTHKRHSESNGESKNFLVCTNEASLLYMANLGCIEMNPWHSRTQKPENPDWSVIDLDPGTNSFEEVIETALVVKGILDQFDLPSCIKTSGSTGLHIYVPFGAKYSYDQSKQFAEIIAHMVHDALPDITSLERNPLKRKDKIYVDYLQNRPIQTICAPYSVRPKPGATVSAPLHWHEVKPGLKMEQFTIHNILERIESEGDLFKAVLGKGIDLNKLLQKLTQAS